MSAIKGNIGKWKLYVSGRLFSTGTGGNQDLNVDLQENLADELDGIMSGIVGTAVVGASSWQVLPTTNALEVKVSSGQGFFSGQRGYTTGDFTVTPPLPANSIVRVYIEIDADATAFDTTTNTWPVKVGWIGPASPIPSNSIVLALVSTPASGVIQLANIVDQRRIVETDYDTAATIDDKILPAATALTTRSRLSMLASQIRTAIGGQSTTTNSWMDPVKDDGPLEGSAWSLTKLGRLFAREQPASGTGHRHRGDQGPSGDGPRVEARYAEFTPTPGSADIPKAIGITATRVQTALEQVVERKLDTNGNQDMTGLLKLFGDPTDPRHGATKQWVEAQITSAVNFLQSQVRISVMASTELKKLVNVGPSGPGGPQPGGLPINNPWNHQGLQIISKGGAIRFEASSPILVKIHTQPQAQFSSSHLYIEWEFRFRRGGTPQSVPLKIENIFLDVTTSENTQQVFQMNVPIFYDQPGIGTHTYYIDILENPIGQGHTYSDYVSTNAAVLDGPQYWYAIEH